MKILQDNDKKVLKKDMLRLSPLKKNDVTERYVAWLNDPQINRYLEVRHNVPVLKGDVELFVEKCIFDKRPHWGIFDGAKHIGNVSCSAYDLRARWIDISFLLGERDYWGRGICTDAVAIAMEYLFLEQKFNKIQGGTYSENKGSVRIFEKLGFSQEACLRQQGIIDGNYADILKFGLLKEDWVKSRNGRTRFIVESLPWSFFSE